LSKLFRNLPELPSEEEYGRLKRLIADEEYEVVRLNSQLGLLLRKTSGSVVSRGVVKKVGEARKHFENNSRAKARKALGEARELLELHPNAGDVVKLKKDLEMAHSQRNEVIIGTLDELEESAPKDHELHDLEPSYHHEELRSNLKSLHHHSSFGGVAHPVVKEFEVPTMEDLDFLARELEYLREKLVSSKGKKVMSSSVEEVNLRLSQIEAYLKKFDKSSVLTRDQKNRIFDLIEKVSGVRAEGDLVQLGGKLSQSEEVSQKMVESMERAKRATDNLLIEDAELLQKTIDSLDFGQEVSLDELERMMKISKHEILTASESLLKLKKVNFEVRNSGFLDQIMGKKIIFVKTKK